MTSLASATDSGVTTETLLDRVDAQRILAGNHTADRAERGALGQYFTPATMADFMAGFFEPLPREVSLLDPGAGAGALCSAFAVRALTQTPKMERLHITAWEIEPTFVHLLHDTLGMIGELCRQHGVEFTFRVEEGDFVQHVPPVLEHGPLFGGGTERFDCVLMNPPYRKIPSASSHRRTLSGLGLETANLYTAFLWLAAKDLKPQGQLVSINPRSFANGPYYFPFRKAFLDEMTIRRVHLFNSRTSAFKDDDVLQENVVLQAVKARLNQPVTITASDSLDEAAKERTVPQEDFIDRDDPERFIHLVADELGARIRTQMRRFRHSLQDLGVNVSTGRVVDFRAKPYLQREATPDSVPLIYPGHFNGVGIAWPREKFKKCNHFRRCPESEPQLVEAGHYVLVKRFTAKEEKRRVVSAVLSPDDLPATAYALENHLNYFHRNGKGLPANLARGLSALLNSTLFDEYFRQFNGHTQVNATDLRTMRYPEREALIAFGRKIGDKALTQEELDNLVTEHLTPMADTNDDPVKAKKKIEEALDVLKQLDVPRAQQNERSALTLLALLGLKPDTPWKNASQVFIGITEMMDWFRDHYGVSYAPNTRETVRRQTVHQFLQIGIARSNADSPDRPTNSPNYGYEIEPSALELFRAYGKRNWRKTRTRGNLLPREGRWPDPKKLNRLQC